MPRSARVGLWSDVLALLMRSARVHREAFLPSAAGQRIMFKSPRQQRAEMDSAIWQPIIDAWRDLGAQQVFVMSDTVSAQSEEATSTTNRLPECSKSWIWHKV